MACHRRIAWLGILALAACGEAAPPAPLAYRPLLGPGQPAELRAGAPWVRRLELPGGGRVRVAGRAQGPGELRARATLVDPGGGPARPAGAVSASAGGQGPLELVLPLPDPGTALFEVETSWTPSAPGAPFVADRAVVAEARSLPRPSIIFVSLDTLSARHTSLYGYARRTTPQLERLARESVVFDHCLTNAPWTTPSYVSQFTGLYPASFGLDDERPGPPRASWNNWSLPERRWTLAEMLAAAGYRTAAFVDNLLIGPSYGFPQGFERYDTTAACRPKTDPDGGIRQLVPLALDWLDGLPPGEPFFLFVQANDAHGPYLPDPPWAGRFRDDALAAAPEEVPVSSGGQLFGHIPGYVAEPLFPPGELPHSMRAAPIVEAYDEEILLLDDALGGFFESLRQRGLLDGAVLIVSADHGESTGEHDEYFGHNRTYEEVLHVPLMIRLPGAARGGARVAGTVQLVDLYPTLAELAGLRGDRPWLAGRSLVPLLEGHELPAVPTFASEGWFDSVCVTLDGWKLIERQPARYVERNPGMLPLLLSSPRAERWFEQRHPDWARIGSLLGLIQWYGRQTDQIDGFLDELMGELAGPFDELYALPDDPLEARDLSAEQPDRVRLLKAALARELERARDEYQPDDAAPGHQPDPQELESLRQLGYVEGH